MLDFLFLIGSTNQKLWVDKYMMQEGSKQRLSTVDRAMSLLSLFLKYDAVSLVDIEKEIKIGKTSAFRMTATMLERGFLVKDAETKRYSPGPILFQLVRKFKLNDIVTISRPLIQQLAEMTGETVYLSIRSGHRYIYIGGIESKKSLKVTSPIGDEVGLYYSAAGKVHMAFMPSSEIDIYFKHTILESYTAQTHTDREQLEEELYQIRERNYSISFGERESGSGGVAAPIWGQEDEPTAVLSVVLPLSRIKKQQLVELVSKYAADITSQYNNR